MSHNHCYDEHSHSHGDGSNGHNHDHAHDHSDDITPALQNHLYEQIDFASVRVLNEKEAGSGRSVIEKTWAQRLEPSPEVESDADEQIIAHIPFTGQVRLHSIHIRTSPSDTAPKTVHVYLNTDDLDFNTVNSATPKQTFTLSQTSDVQDINVKRTLFTSTRSLTLFFEDNFSGGDEDVTSFTYLGFKGDFMKLSREPVEVMYESAARPSDHKVKGQGVDALGTGFGAGSGGRQGF